MLLVHGMMLDIWEDEAEKARCFMQTKHHLLDNRSPFEASLSEPEARQVEDLLRRIEKRKMRGFPQRRSRRLIMLFC